MKNNGRTKTTIKQGKKKTQFSMVASNPTIPIITLNTNKLKLHLKEIGRKQNPALCFLQETDCFFGCAAQYVGT